MYLYFKYKENSIFNIPSSIVGDILCVRLNFFHDFHAFLWNVMGGRLIEYQIVKNGNKICSARVVRKIWFFPFMQSNGLHIGPCFTVESERGKGLYPYLLSHIVNDNEGKEFFMIVNKNNTSSIKGVLKAGFIPFAKGHKNIFNRYVIDQVI